jgi:hypothetical protein
LMLQLATSISSFPASRRRVLDFDDMCGHAVRVFNFMLNSIQTECSRDRVDLDDELAKTAFLICGFSWRRQRFRICIIRYESKRRVYVKHRHKVLGRTCVFIGDVSGGDDISVVAKRMLGQRLRHKGKLREGGTLDWEPFEVLAGIVKSGDYREVGGAPQVAKVYRHHNTQSFAVYWPDSDDGNLTLGGRKAMDFELTDWPRLDAATCKVTSVSLDDVGEESE